MQNFLSYFRRVLRSRVAKITKSPVVKSPVEETPAENLLGDTSALKPPVEDASSEPAPAAKPAAETLATDMAPAAVTPPAVEEKPVSRPVLNRVNTANMHTKRKIICFSDFDGTIFMQDTGHQLFDNFGCGPERRKVLAHELESGERSFKEVSNELYHSLDVPFEDCFEVMKTALEIDPDFQTFHEFCVNNSIPFNVISAGLKPVLRRVLDHFIGEDMSAHIEIVANDAEITTTEESSKWQAVWRHPETELGHDKAQSINEYKAAARLESDNGTVPMIVFIGDGVSDLPAAREADVLFARRGLRLEEYCIENKVDYIPFDTFADIQREVIKIAKVDDEKTRGEGLPSNFNPRANMWRRASSKNNVNLKVWNMMTPTREEKAFIWPETFTQPTAGAAVKAAAAAEARPVP